MALSAALSSAELRIAVVNINEIEDVLKIKVLAKPENAEFKKQILASDLKMRAAHEKLSSIKDDDMKRKDFMTEIEAINSEKNDAEQSVRFIIKGELIKVCKEVAKGRYIVVLNADHVGESIVTKESEIIDITIDVKEFLLTK